MVAVLTSASESFNKTLNAVSLTSFKISKVKALQIFLINDNIDISN